ncbi:AGL010Wp [Eremothecium gossypii ATCC 10895]|uniref:ATP-dependent DNA helicase CHL1 n=1 Tax=Eremothecium gossypii (strain ATCC 10895 / CBS 109.51 / FGSC 9923 / NRRL Y-1056) TaxID=284811 RepID=CHL1_EREGS|nr:AGL010Wp [Eremothecium gossypii ATCC 10895]Q750G3.1 RecName: Full=ATP-dependent DNA helicase CHL1; AltName: Full=Chromosome loss protein 1 [Eremothecium gossypii ATCC 10895]AAS54480.1 AGL010Wp [Eremothecium gossypii ATCC 10895]AEY98812.1 FAGL010Wp [Eremothecium gossypii FDAG1]
MGRCEFYHPFTPYRIQLELMQQIYGLLESGKKMGIFESPTGTGKTLSLICSTFTWLREHKAGYLQGSTGAQDSEEDSEDEPAWVKENYEQSVLADVTASMRAYEQRLAAVDTDLLVKGAAKRQRVEVAVERPDDGAEFLPDAYHSDVEERPSHAGGRGQLRKQLDADIKRLLRKLDEPDAADKSRLAANPLKVYFASRTHTQLGQFAAQLRLPQFPPSLAGLEQERVKFLPLGSRKQLCIHKKVSKVKSDGINEACMDAVSKSECSFFSAAREPDIIRQFQDQAFSTIQDIEDLVGIGNTLHACPYYSSRELIEGAEVITLPYQHLLLENARKTMGIDLRDSIIVIDEAHNLIDTINSIHSASISLTELRQCKLALQAYLAKFKTRLNSGNRVNLLKLIKMVDVLSQFIETQYKNGKRINDPNDIFMGTSMDVVNIHKLEKYMKTSKVAYKIDKYIQATTSNDLQDRGSRDIKQPILFKVASFLKTLANPSEEGQFFFENGHVLKYMLLEPSEVLKSIVTEAKCVILAGGTMEPVNDFFTQLVPYLAPTDVTTYSCGHVIPDDNLNAFIVSENFEFTFANREDIALIERLFHFIYQLASRVPFGMVVFFSSYKYIDFVVKTWTDRGLLSRLDAIKRIYHETSDGADVLKGYSETIQSEKKGAILLAVVGGRLSEGINFENELARAVVLVGLPFPNMFSGEMIVKQQHIKEKVIRNGGTQEDVNKAVREFYENICMKAVNQSVGRAIRHASDFANVYLIDKRYSGPRIQQKLSDWVRKRIQSASNIPKILSDTEAFFSGKGL